MSILTKIFKTNQETKEIETTTLTTTKEVWVVMFPSMERESFLRYGTLLRVSKSFKAFSSKEDAKMFYNSVIAAFTLTSNKHLQDLVSLYKEENYSL